MPQVATAHEIIAAKADPTPLTVRATRTGAGPAYKDASILKRVYKKPIYILLILSLYTFLVGMSSLEYTRKVEPLADMPKGDPDPSLGIVVHSNSTGIDVLRDSSQNIRFSASKNYAKTDIERLSSSSMVDRTPKKFKFIDEKHGFSSDNIFEFTMSFNYKNHQWEYIRFMPFPSVIEWVTEEKLREYLDQWVKTFEDAGWERIEYPKSANIQNFKLPTPKFYNLQQYCSWTTNEYKAVIRVSLRNNKNYKNYVLKAERKNIKSTPDGYIAFIEITKNSQYE